MFATWSDVAAAGTAAFAIACVSGLFEVPRGDGAGAAVRLERTVEAGLPTSIAGESRT